MKQTFKQILKDYGIKPNKVMGQNFLIDSNVLREIIQTANISPEETVLEIGPGLGILTQELIKKAKKVISVEKDKKMVEILEQRFKNCKNLEIIEGDILKTNFSADKIVANIPYYLTSPLIRMFLESSNQPKEMILLVQKEVAQRICAKPPKMTILSVSVQLYSQPKIISYVSNKSFWPAPKVNSAIIKISEIKKPKIDTKKFFKVLKIGFSSPRKKLVNNLAGGLRIKKEETKRALIELNINPQIRAQNLSVNDWINLANRV